MPAISRSARGERLSGLFALGGTSGPTFRNLRFKVGPTHLAPGVQLHESLVDLLDKPLGVIQPVSENERQQLIGSAPSAARQTPQPFELGRGNGKWSIHDCQLKG